MSNRALGRFVSQMRSALAGRDPAALSDAELLGLIRAQPTDPAAFETLVRRHGPMVLGVCRRALSGAADADDAFQATFLVFLRRAGSLRHPERLAGWLYQVAYRTAKQARRRAARRREEPLPDVPAPEPVAELVWRDLRPICDAELSRLPERYRLPVVLCFLEGRTKREAAGVLGWAEGTLASRLQRARELLRGRLARRGLTLSAGVFPLALFEGGAGAAVPAPLLASTIQAATAAATLSVAPAVLLAKGVIQSMVLSKIKVVAAAIVAVTVVGGGTSLLLDYSAGGSVAHAADQGTGVPSADPQPAQKHTRDLQLELKLLTTDLRVRGVDLEAMRKTWPHMLDVEQMHQEAGVDPNALLNQEERTRMTSEQRRKLAEARAKREQFEKYMHATLDREQKELDSWQEQLSDLGKENREALKTPPATPSDKATMLALLKSDVEMQRERVAWAERMVKKGYMTAAQLQAEKVKLAAKEAELAHLKTMLNDALRRVADLKADLLDKDVKDKAERYTKIAELVKQGAATQADEDRARVELAEARMALARANIREELRAIVEVRERELQRAQTLHQAGALAEAELQKARKTAEEARQRLAEAK